ncbi:MAG: serine/threonine-protein kinase, partial [Gemmatimonadaceae bacterium]|nr:serine/threonine-protein kinase [Gemmatimonadaceae bacterium]
MSSDTGTFDTLRSAIADRYALERELGRGGMATVFLARDLRHERQVALKVLHAELGAVLGAERFLSEIRTTANLQHPNILPLFDSGAAAGLVFYVMPFVSGETLRSRLQREGQLSVAETVRLARGIGAALDYAHRQGVIHRDIKPENILLQDGQPLVADFGIALAVSNAGGTRITQTGLSVGTPAYMSPEQAAAERQLDGRSDQYSLASVLYEMLAGAPPFTGASAAAVMSKLMTEVPARIETARASVPSGVSDALARALEKVPADRFDTVAQFIEALGADASGGYRSTRALPGAERVWKRRAMVYAGVGVAGVAAALVVPRVMTPAVNTAAASSGEPRFYSIALPDSLPMVSAKDIWGVRLRSLDISPDGRRLVYNTIVDSTPRLAVADLASGQVKLIPGTDGALLPTVSPRSDELAFARIQGASGTQIWKVALDAPVPTLVHRTTVILQNLSWAGDSRLNYGDFQTCFSTLDITNGRVLPPDSTACLAVVPATARTRADLTAITVDTSVALYDFKQRKVRTVHPAEDSTLDIAGISPRIIGEKYLAFVRDSNLWVAPVDLGSARLRQQPKMVFTGIRSESMPREAQISFTNEGTMVWASNHLQGGTSGQSAIVRVSPSGKVVDTIAVADEPITSVIMSPNGRYVAYSLGHILSSTSLILLDLVTGTREVKRLTSSIEPFSFVTNAFFPMVVISRRYGHRLLSSIDGLVTLDASAPGLLGQSANDRYRCRNGKLWASNAPNDIIQLTPEGFGSCAFSPDGKWVIVRNPSGLFLAPTASASRESVVQISSRGDYDGPAWTADSRSVIGRAGDTWYQLTIDESGRRIGPERPYLRGEFAQAQVSYSVDPKGNLILITSPPA